MKLSLPYNTLFYLLLSCTMTNYYGLKGVKNFVLIAPPGAGKGTFSQYLSAYYNYSHICPGDLFRDMIRKQTPLGEKIQKIVENGEYVCPSIVCNLVAKRIEKAQKDNLPFILDGFPRRLESFHFMSKFLEDKKLAKNTCFLQLVASDELCTKRILSRKVCNNCFAVYNLHTKKPKKCNICDTCHKPLSTRKSDSLVTIKKRLTFFHETIEPLIPIAQQKNYAVKKIDTNTSLKELQAKYNELIK